MSEQSLFIEARQTLPVKGTRWLGRFSPFVITFSKTIAVRSINCVVNGRVIQSGAKISKNLVHEHQARRVDDDKTVIERMKRAGLEVLRVNSDTYVNFNQVRDVVPGFGGAKIVFCDGQQVCTEIPNERIYTAFIGMRSQPTASPT